MGFTCYWINLRIIASFLRGSLFSASNCFCQNNEALWFISLRRKRLLNCLHQVLRIDLRFAFYYPGFKMLKKRSKQTVIMNALSFITTERQGTVWGIWFKWFCQIHARMRCWALPSRQKSKSMTKVVCTLLVFVCMKWSICKTNVNG